MMGLFKTYRRNQLKDRAIDRALDYTFDNTVDLYSLQKQISALKGRCTKLETRLKALEGVEK